MNYYDILGVQKDASPKDIKDAYRKLSKEHHPDKEGGDQEKFSAIAEAYETLGNKENREHYDKTGTVKKKDHRVAYLSDLIRGRFIPLVYHFANNNSVDLIKEFEDELKAIHANMRDSLVETQKKIECLETTLSRITSKGEENLISVMIQAEIERYNSMKESMRGEINNMKWCIDFISDYEYKTTKSLLDNIESDLRARYERY